MKTKQKGGANPMTAQFVSVKNKTWMIMDVYQFFIDLFQTKKWGKLQTPNITNFQKIPNPPNENIKAKVWMKTIHFKVISNNPALPPTPRFVANPENPQQKSPKHMHVRNFVPALHRL